MPTQKYDKPVGVIGAGSFGTAIANLLAHNVDVLLFSRRQEVVDNVNQHHSNMDIPLSKRIKATNNLEELAEKCTLIFPVVPSASFRKTMQSISPYLKPYHILIHGTKGFDLSNMDESQLRTKAITRDTLKTMSEVILEESAVVRVGCLTGPNLASEIIAGQPTATVIASKFSEVIQIGKKVLNSSQFHVFGTNDILGAELAGALKNAIAIGSGLLAGKGLGKNIQAMLITRGLVEMIHIGKALGTSSQAFLGVAGIGDLIATATSTNSRNFSFGKRLASGETMEQINSSMPEMAEGVRTLQIVRQLARTYRIHVPIMSTIYNVVYENYDIHKALDYLVTYPYDVDVDFM